MERASFLVGGMFLGLLLPSPLTVSLSQVLTQSWFLHLQKDMRATELAKADSKQEMISFYSCCENAADLRSVSNSAAECHEMNMEHQGIQCPLSSSFRVHLP